MGKFKKVLKQNVQREKTAYKNIYYNVGTGKYDVKYNYKEYDPVEQKNKYKSKWTYNLKTLAEAKIELANLQTGNRGIEDKNITLEGAFQLWKFGAEAKAYSPVTIRNTEQHMHMIYQFLPKETQVKNITEEIYYKFASQCRQHGYSEETLHSINATFRKMINLCYKKKLIKDNILHTSDNIRTKQKEDYRVVSKEEFEIIDAYLHNHSFVRLGVDNYPAYRLMFNILYYTGLRIGECLALTYRDFEEFSYFRKGKEPFPLHIPRSENVKGEHLQGMRIKVTKAYVSDIKLTKDPKNLKKRSVPLYSDVERLFIKFRNNHIQNGGELDEKLFNWGHGAADTKLKTVCKKCGLPDYSCHEFRHTFISNLINQSVPLPVIEKVSGDTQATILKRYSHMFEQDETMVLIAMSNLE